MKERDYQASLIKKLERRYPGCFVMKNDPSHIQGVPDLTILHNGTWAMLECKIDRSANVQPNQQHYVDRLSEMSYASFIFPEIEDAVLSELDGYFLGGENA